MGALEALHPSLFAFVATAVSLVTLFVVLIIAVRQRKLLNRYRILLSGSSGLDLEGMLLAQATATEGLQAELARLTQQVDVLTREARMHVQKVGVIRFNAFPDTGSDLSFAIALLDAQNNGVVLSSLYGRSESRMYAKPIQEGKSTYTLSGEEKQAIARSMGQPLPEN